MLIEEVRKRIKIERKIESEVIDRDVLLTLGYLMNRKLITTVDFPVSKGKEAYVFRATGGENAEDKYLALKIYMIETGQFTHMYGYIHGDPRFRGVKRNKRDIVYAWTKKEFRNLKICEIAGVHAPVSYFFHKNVLLMSFIGDDGSPARLLKEVGPPDPKENYRQLIKDIRKLYNNNLVHADISEYNILVKGDQLYLIDIGQGVTLEHPMAERFLERDVQNVVRYFSKFGVKADKEKVLNDIKR